MESLRSPNSGNDIVYTFGSFDSPISQTDSNNNSISLGDIPITEYNMKLKLSSQRLQQALEAGATTARDEGIALHGIMERCHTREEIVCAIEQLVIDGIISNKEGIELLAHINSALSDPTAAEWFNGKWDRIYTECEILSTDGKINRPDRVMTSGNKAVVVDYKFGKAENSHRTQILTYHKLLTGMGYSDIEGYIWYVREGKIEKVI